MNKEKDNPVTETRILYIDGDIDSINAQKELDQQHLDYVPIDLRNFTSTDVQAPRLLSHLGQFDGLAEITRYASFFK